MEMDKAQFAEQLKNLVELGKKKKNVLEYQEINDFFKGITLNNEQMDLIFEYLESNGVDVLRVTEDDALLDNEDMHMEEDEVEHRGLAHAVLHAVQLAGARVLRGKSGCGQPEGERGLRRQLLHLGGGGVCRHHRGAEAVDGHL